MQPVLTSCQLVTARPPKTKTIWSFSKNSIQRAQALPNIKKSAPVETNTSRKLYYKWTMTNPTTYDDSFLYIVTEYKIYIVMAMHKKIIFQCLVQRLGFEIIVFYDRL